MTTTLKVHVNGNYQRNVIINGVSTVVGPNEEKSFYPSSMRQELVLTAEEYVTPNSRDAAQEAVNATRDETHPAGASSPSADEPTGATEGGNPAPISETTTADVDEVTKDMVRAGYYFDGGQPF